MNEIKTPWGEIGYITYKRTYARKLNPNKPETEEFPQTIQRVIKACDKQLKVGFTPKEETELEKMLLELKGSVAGRFLWQLGTKTVDKLGLPSLQNCAGVVVNEPIRPFTWTMELLMLGAGVGYNIQKEHVYSLPKLGKKIKITRVNDASADFIVPDTREGWVKLLGKVLKAHYYSHENFTYSTILVRGKGAPITGFGGTASGPEVLCKGIEQIHDILNKRSMKKLRPIDCLDIMNIIGSIVVAGNVRRSAQIALGDPDDIDFLKAKRWDLGDIPNWRSMSNNSIVTDNINNLPDEFWQTYEQGEPYGLINISLSKKVGRLGEFQYPDPNVEVYNPCQPDFATVIIKGKGLSTFKDLEVGDEIWSKEHWTKVTDKWCTGVKPVYEYRTTTGAFIGTDNHKVDTKHGKVEVDNAESILTISGEYKDYNSLDLQAVMDGMFFGDGYFKCRDKYGCHSLLSIGKDDQDYFDSEISHLIKNRFQGDESRADFEVVTTVTREEKVRSYDLRIPKRFFKNKTYLASFLRGLYTADGSVVLNKGKTCRVTYKTASKGLAEDVQLALSYLGMRSYITTNKPKKVKFDNGEYLCKESYDVNISSDRVRFFESVGFLQKYKMEKIESNIGRVNSSATYSSVKEKSYLGEFEVFDITVDNPSHTYWTGGLSVSNCAEQSLENHETCCLAEIFLSNINSKKELFKIAKYLYRINKHSLALPCSLKETEKIVHKNMRMGIGVTGTFQATDEQRSWLSECYTMLRQYDIEYSKQHGWNPSIKITTSKPSGTLSLLKGVTPGSNVNPAGPWYIRRIRISSDSPLVKACENLGYKVEFQRNFDKSLDYTTKVVEFPCSVPLHTPVAKTTTALEQLEMIKWVQTNWSDNSVSVTVNYKKDELPEIKEWLSNNYTNSVKTVSFLLTNDHGFDQAPYEDITEEEYNEMIKNIKPIISVEVNESDISEDQINCTTGACPIK